MFKKIANLVKCIHRANKAEIEQIKNLVVTDVDRKQAEYIQHVCAVAMTQCGVPPSIAQSRALNTALAYAIRDLKEGGKQPSTLLVNRIVDEIKESRRKTP